MTTLELSDELFEQLSNLANDRDVSVESLLQQLLVRDATFENSMDGLLIADDNMQYVDVNPVACELLGYTKEELLQIQILDIVAITEHVQEEWETFAQTGKMRGEYNVIHKDGHEILIDFVAVSSVIPGRHVSIFRDITEQKKVQEQLIESEKRFKAFMDHAPLIAYIKDALSNYLFTNSHMRELTFKKNMNINNRTPYEDLPAHVARSIRHADHQVLERNAIVEMDEYAMWEEDDLHWFKEIKFPVVGIDDTIHIGGFAIEITSLKQAEHQLLLREQFISEIASTVPGVIYVFDLRMNKLIYTNKRIADYLGYTLDDDIHQNEQPIHGLMHSGDFQRVQMHFEDIKQIEDNEEVLEITYRMKHKDGHWVWFHSRDKVAKRDEDGHVIHIMGIAIDVSEKERLKFEQQSFLDHSPIPIGISTSDEQVEYYNNVFTETFGYTVDDTPDIDTWRKLAYPDPKYREQTYQQWNEDLELAEQDQSSVPARIYYIIDKWGQQRAVMIHVSIIGERRFATFMDVTEEQRIKLALMENEHRYRTLFENALYNIVIYNLDGSIQMINKQAALFLGGEPADMIGCFMDAFEPNRHESTITFINKVLENNSATYIEEEIDIDGETQFLWSVAQPVFSSSGEISGIQVITHDITAQRQAEAFQLEQEKLALKLQKERQLSDLRTRLLTTISHEFRTPLAVILTNTEILMRYRDRLTIDRKDEKLNQIIAQIQHLTSMLDNIRTMSEAQQNRIDYQAGVIDLSAFVDSIQRRFEMNNTKSHNLDIRLVTDAPTAKFDSNLMEQAMMNLLTNSQKYSSESTDINITIEQSGKNLTFKIQDNGIGIARKDLPHIYQPFYRGKNTENMRGTGLGLAIVHEIVGLHRGTISCESKLGQGATFTIYMSKNLI